METRYFTRVAAGQMAFHAEPAQLCDGGVVHDPEPSAAIIKLLKSAVLADLCCFEAPALGPLSVRHGNRRQPSKRSSVNTAMPKASVASK